MEVNAEGHDNEAKDTDASAEQQAASAASEEAAPTPKPTAAAAAALAAAAAPATSAPSPAPEAFFQAFHRSLGAEVADDEDGPPPLPVVHVELDQDDVASSGSAASLAARYSVRSGGSARGSRRQGATSGLAW